MVQQRIFTAAVRRHLFQPYRRSGQRLPAAEGTDMKYGARHLKRAVDRNLVHPMSNLIATGQICGGDLLRVDFNHS
jgi:ATP-dependent Clp protease ATP-binding subunit ClpA